MSDAAIIELRGVEARPGSEESPLVLKGCSFSVYPSERVVILGESGAGKTTALRAIARLIPVEGGNLRATDSIGWLPQHPLTAFDPRWPVIRSVCEPLILAGENRTDARERAVKLLRSVKLSNMQWDLRPAALSGGQIRRAAIARALAASPAVILADEPTAGLDPEAAILLVDLFREMTAIHRTAVVWVTHDLGIASAVADRVIVLAGGKIVEVASMERLALNPRTEASRRLLKAWLPLDPVAARRQFSEPGSVAPNPAAWITADEEEEKPKSLY